jgi:hypothetical protein
MQIIDEENDRAAEDSRWRDWFCRSVSGITERREFSFSRAAGSDAFKERYRTSFAIDHQLKLLALETIDEVAFLVEHGDGGLDQVDICADNFGLLRGCERANRDEQ